MLAVEVDSSERPDIPPFGNEIDYLTFGGIYREVQLRVVPPTFIENIFAQPKDVLSANPTVDVQCFLESDQKSPEERLLAGSGALRRRTAGGKNHAGCSGVER